MNSAVAATGPVAFLYRWKVKPGMEAQFVQAWTRRTDALRARGGSLGSRLHRGDDGLWYGYAVWPSAQARRDAFAMPADEDGRAMDEAVAERLPEIMLSPVADRLQAAAPDGQGNI
ncbi:putative quinol monooxygenase [Luteimonas aquatica]|uniref:putative quinol monooxygenase n=1 Tax=Luteimonas aquatica TaxID=450364 RepID=UPI001F586CA1|nr:antibiotic biosynthesis monooxygenase [Luteimonas aquatica]